MNGQDSQNSNHIHDVKVHVFKEVRCIQTFSVKLRLSEVNKLFI